MTTVDESIYPADKVVRITATFADGSTVTGAGALVEFNPLQPGPIPPLPSQPIHNDEVLTAADLVWKPGVGAAISVAVDPKLNGVNSYGEIAADHFRYFPIASNGAAGDQFDFALLHLATPFADPQPGPPRGPQSDPPGAIETYFFPFGGSSFQGYTAQIYGYPTTAGGATIDKLPVIVAPNPSTSTAHYALNLQAPPRDPGYVGAVVWLSLSGDALARAAGVETADGQVAEITQPLYRLLDSWITADNSGTTQPSGAITIPLPLTQTITPDTGAPGVDPAEARLVDKASYLLNRPDVAAAGVDAAAHFANFGWHEMTPPDLLFDVKYYLSRNPDVASAGIDPLLHYALYGWHEGRDPSAAFSTSAYLATYPDVALAGIDPLEHYLWFGIAEVRAVAPGKA